MASNIFPSLSLDDAVNVRDGNSKQRGNHFCGHRLEFVHRSNLFNLIHGKFGTRVRYSSFAQIASALSNRIHSIFGVSSRPEMGWITTSFVCDARMQDEQPERDVSFVMHYPSDSVGTSNDRFSFEKQSECTVPIFGLQGGLPWPAFIHAFNFNFRPEAIVALGRKDLLQQSVRYNFGLHNSDSLICATLPARQSAGALLF